MIRVPFPRPATPLLFALLLLLLTAAALWWPRPGEASSEGSLLVLAPAWDARREESLTALTAYAGRALGRPLRLEVARDHTAFRAGLSEALVVLCPDGVAVPLPASAWQPVATGRRRVPWNLRPASVLLTRRGVPPLAAPWHLAPGRTAVGDSLSLVCLAPLCAEERGGRLPPGVAWGDDPYDHGAMLVAARHGAFDYVLARQWDVESALGSGRLDHSRWHVQTLSDPLPDVVVMASRRLPLGSRLALRQALTILGRQEPSSPAESADLAVQLGRLGLDGFNALLAPDFDRTRRQYGPCWPLPGP